MAVPDTITFNLHDVTNEIYGDTNSNRNLIDCFDDAIAGSFDSNYSGSKDSLLNFRAYSQGTLTSFTCSDIEESSNFDNSCSLTVENSFYHTGSGSYPSDGDNVYLGTPANKGNAISNGRFRTGNNKSCTTDSSGTVISSYYCSAP
jgi:hypothetical protein